MCDRTYWRHQIKYFTKSHQVVALDLGGHGESSSERKDWTMTAFGEDVRAIVEKLELQKVVLIGHSLGALVIVEAARLMPERVLAVVPVDYFNEVDDQMTEREIVEYIDQVRADFQNWTKTAVRRWVPKNTDPKLVDWVADDMSSGSPEVGISAMEHARRNNDGEALTRVKAQIHLINSDFWQTNLKAAHRYNPNIELSIVKGVGHFLMLESPYKFNRILEDVIGRITLSVK
jgi:pimeloyl-ACP methyl ester carboxylesterase